MTALNATRAAHWLASAVVLGLSSGCLGVVESIDDAGPGRDAGVNRDAGAFTDAGGDDAGLQLDEDGGAVLDAGEVDAGAPLDGGSAASDAGAAFDAGSVPDGGASSDAGSTSSDAGSAPDAGSAVDAGIPDAGTAVDGGVVALFVPARPAYWYVDRRPLVVTDGGAGVTHYKYALDSAAFSAEFAVATPISISTIAAGKRTLKIIGRGAAGVWQVTPTTASFHMVSPESEPVPSCTLRTDGGMCDLIISAQKSYFATATTFIDNNMNGQPDFETIVAPQPGWRVCLKSGGLQQVSFTGFVGSAENPITITNCGGRADFAYSGAGQAIGIYQSRYVRVVGTGDPNFTHGIRLTVTGAQAAHGLEFTKGTSDFEAAYVEVASAAYAGVAARTDVSCQHNRATFVQNNTFLHHNFIHDTKGEGFYIGGSHWGSPDRVDAGLTTCGAFGNGTVLCSGVCRFESELHGVRVHDNLIDHTDADGLQLSSALGDLDVSDGRVDWDTEVYDNVVRRATSGAGGYNSGGMSIQGGTTGRVFRNQVIDTFAGGGYAGMFLAGPGHTFAYNNLVVGNTTVGIGVQDNDPSIGAGAFVLVNNTIVGATNEGIYMYHAHSTGNRCHNNIILGATLPIRLNSGSINWTASNNVIAGTLASHFVDVDGGDYHLVSSSSAIDNGINTAGYGVLDDLDKRSRDAGTYDIGAYEYRP